MEFVRSYIVFAVLIALIWAGATFIPPYLRTATVPAGYRDLNGLDEVKTYHLDTDLRRLQVGDGIVYRLGSRPEKTLCFGWIAGLPGDQVAIKDGYVVAKGGAVHAHDRLSLPDLAALTVPDGHVFVVSSHHYLDSIAGGPLPLGAIAGRVGSLP